jgi:hypothetical protein
MARPKSKPTETTYGTPKYPYASTPSSLGRFLSMVPNKPRPEKVNAATLKAWDFKNTNDQSILRVLKAIELITPTNEPAKVYEDFMQPGKGPAVLGNQIKKIYSTLFSTVTNPGNASTDELKRFFNTYGGGGEKVVQLQVQTFKAIASHATFGASDPLEQSSENTSNLDSGNGTSTQQSGNPAIRIDLHIHLPENKTKADYDSILEGIAKHIYGKNI